MFKIRCSAIGHIMTDPRTKAAKEAGELSDTAKTHLIDIFVAKKYGRHSDTINKYVVKGLAVEEDAITLYSELRRKVFIKNEIELQNEYLRGTPDLFEGDDIYSATKIIDIKSSFDIYTFMRAKYAKAINKDYYYQLQGYMALTGAKEADLVYCLVNTPNQMILDEQRRLQWKLNVLDNDEILEEGFQEIEFNMTYDDIPKHERVFKINIKRDDEVIEEIYARVERCRKYYKETFFPELSETAESIVVYQES